MQRTIHRNLRSQEGLTTLIQDQVQIHHNQDQSMLTKVLSMFQVHTTLDQLGDHTAGLVVLVEVCHFLVAEHQVVEVEDIWLCSDAIKAKL